MALDFEKNRQEVERRLKELTKYCMISGALDLNLYQEYDVKRGLRESSGKGVLTGLTEFPMSAHTVWRRENRSPRRASCFIRAIT